jgi:hypothetical protein
MAKKHRQTELAGFDFSQLERCLRVMQTDVKKSFRLRVSCMELMVTPALPGIVR